MPRFPVTPLPEMWGDREDVVLPAQLAEGLSVHLGVPILFKARQDAEVETKLR